MATPTIPGLENAIAAQRNALEASLEIAGKAIEGIERLSALNLQLVRETLDQQGEFAKASLGAKDPSTFASLSKNAAAPAAERAAAYAKQVYAIASETSAAITGSVQSQVKAAQKTMAEALDAAARTAPAGSEQMFAAARSALQVASQTVEQAVNAGGKLAEAANQGVEQLAKAGTAAAKKAAV